MEVLSIRQENCNQSNGHLDKHLELYFYLP